jgi:cell wall-associated NlpC family hydrolase
MIFDFKRVVVFVFLIAAFVSTSPVNAHSKVQQEAASDTLNSIESLISFASKHLHVPYRLGGSSKKGFDCSGFVRYCFKKWDILLPHSSEAQARHGEKVELTEAKPGDLIFFKGQSTKTSRIGHVGIITEVTPSSLRFIHSAWKGGIRYDVLSASYYQKRFVAIRRLTQSEQLSAGASASSNGI